MEFLSHQCDLMIGVLLFSFFVVGTSSMVAAIGYAWLLMNRMKVDYKDRSSGDGNEKLVVPVMNMRRGKMWNYRQAAWLFHHVGLDVNALLFSDEVTFYFFL